MTPPDLRLAPGFDAKLPGSDLRPQVRSTSAIITFFVLTFTWTWGLWGITLAIKPLHPIISNALFLGSAFGPGLAAASVILGFEGRAGLSRWLRQCFRWRVGWCWYALALVVPPLIMLTAIAITARLGGPVPDFPATGPLLLALAQFPLVLIFGGPLGEEYGWRGYALPTLSTRMGWRRASLVIGVAWGVWHLPLLFMADTAQAALPIAWFLASTVGLSVVMARLPVIVGFSVLPALLLHSVINWCSMVLPIMPEGGDASAYSLVCAITILVAVVALMKPGPEMPSRPAPHPPSVC